MGCIAIPSAGIGGTGGMLYDTENERRKHNEKEENPENRYLLPLWQFHRSDALFTSPAHHRGNQR